MTEGIYWTEQQAIAHITNDSEFVARFVVGEPLPDSAIDADVMYWPRHETWETSKLFELRRGARAIAVDALNTARGL